MKKRILAAMLGLALTMGMLVGCGGSEESSTETPVEESAEATEESAVEKETLTMMVFPSTENYETINEKFFEANPDLAAKADIEVVLGGSGDGDVAQKL